MIWRKFLNAVLGKGGHAILPETVNPEAYPYGEGRLAVGGVRMSMLAWNWS